jgi:hypothetical protein
MRVIFFPQFTDYHYLAGQSLVNVDLRVMCEMAGDLSDAALDPDSVAYPIRPNQLTWRLTHMRRLRIKSPTETVGSAVSFFFF